MNYQIVSTVPRINYSKETVQVLVHDCDAEEDKLYVATVDFYEIREYRATNNLPATNETIHKDCESLIKGFFDGGQSSDYYITLTPYHEPKQVREKTYKGNPKPMKDAKEALKLHPYGFIPLDEYHSFIY